MLLVALAALAALAAVAISLHPLFRAKAPQEQTPTVAGKAEELLPATAEAPAVPRMEQEVPPAITNAIAAANRVPRYQVTTALKLTSISQDEGEAAGTAYSYQVFCDPKTGVQTEAPADGPNAAEPRISLNIPALLAAYDKLGTDYRTESVDLHGRQHVKITATMGNPGPVGTIWLDAERFCVSRIEAAPASNEAPSLKISVRYKEWHRQFVPADATIESGGQRAVLKFGEYKALD